MPVVLPPKAWDQWLDPENDDINRLQKLLVPAPAREFGAYEITTRVNNVRNDGPALIEPVPS
jgi:putative SOS response-associated peptidase YedK